MSWSFHVLPHTRKNCVVPLEKNPTIEIRTSRYLRVQHFNARPRDNKCVNETQIYNQYKQSDMSAAHHITMPLKYRNKNHQENVLEHNDSLSQSLQIKHLSIKNHKILMNIYCLDANENKDIVIFLIHGVGSSSDIWHAQIRFFSDRGYEIVAPDLIGHGFSCTIKDANAYHFRELAADVEAIFGRYCKRKNVLVGHSYGSSFAAMLARNHPKNVTKLILISGGSPTPLVPKCGVFSLPYCMLACIKPCLLRKFYRNAFHNKQIPVIPKEEAFNIPTFVLKHTMNGQEWPDGDDLYHQCPCPSLLIYGAQDQLVSLQEEEDMTRVIYDSRLEVIEDAGHMVMIEVPDDVNHLIAEFISK